MAKTEIVIFYFWVLTPVNHSPAATIQSPNNQHPRPGSKAVEEEICISDVPGREGEQAGCNLDAGRVEEDGRGGEVEEHAERTYFIDTTCITQWDCAPFYDRDTQTILGRQTPPNPQNNANSNSNIRYCFNCGSPSHTLSTCPTPPNHALITLSRQLHTFHQQQQQSAHRQALGDFERIHVVEGRRQERLDWLDLFDPGEVRGALLREALGLDTGEEGDACWGDGQWLSNMAIWGYPRGWTGERDPRYEVVRRIEGESDEDEEDDDVFLIIGDAGEEEEITLPTAASHLPHTVPANNPPTTDEDLLSPPPQTTPPIPPPPPPAPAPPQKPHRWASYPTTHFSSAILPIYTGYALPPLPPLSPNPIPNTTAQQALWDNTTPPPPPLTSPPPLPPPPDVIPIMQNEFDELNDGEAEMDLSDSD